MATDQPFKLCTVNNAPERAKRLVGRVIEDVKDQYSIVHAGNAERQFIARFREDCSLIFWADPDYCKELFREHNPDVVVCLHFLRDCSNPLADYDHQFVASMWTPEQSEKVIDAAREINPKVKTLALPQGLQVEKGPDAVVEYIKERLPGLLQMEV